MDILSAIGFTIVIFTACFGSITLAWLALLGGKTLLLRLERGKRNEERVERYLIAENERISIERKMI